MGELNSDLTGERPVFYYYTNNSPADKLEISVNTQRTQITKAMSKAYKVELLIGVLVVL